MFSLLFICIVLLQTNISWKGNMQHLYNTNTPLLLMWMEWESSRVWKHVHKCMTCRKPSLWEADEFWFGVYMSSCYTFHPWIGVVLNCLVHPVGGPSTCLKVTIGVHVTCNATLTCVENSLNTSWDTHCWLEELQISENGKKCWWNVTRVWIHCGEMNWGFTNTKGRLHDDYFCVF